MTDPIYVGEVPGYLVDPERDDDPEALPGWFVDILLSDKRLILDISDIEVDYEWARVDQLDGGNFYTIQLTNGLILQGLVTAD